MILEPTMKENPAFSNAFRFAAESIPASATTTMSLTSCRAWEAVRTGIRVVVSAPGPRRRGQTRLLPCRPCARVTATGREPVAYLTAPLVMPEMIRRWANVKTIRSGRLIRIT